MAPWTVTPLYHAQCSRVTGSIRAFPGLFLRDVTRRLQGVGRACALAGSLILLWMGVAGDRKGARHQIEGHARSPFYKICDVHHHLLEGGLSTGMEATA